MNRRPPIGVAACAPCTRSITWMATTSIRATHVLALTGSHTFLFDHTCGCDNAQKSSSRVQVLLAYKIKVLVLAACYIDDNRQGPCYTQSCFDDSHDCFVIQLAAFKDVNRSHPMEFITISNMLHKNTGCCCIRLATPMTFTVFVLHTPSALQQSRTRFDAFLTTVADSEFVKTHVQFAYRQTV